MTQYSEIAGNMGLYDPDVQEEMRILKERHDREKQDRSLGGGANQQHQLSIDQEVMDIEVDSNNATKGNSMLGSLEAVWAQFTHHPARRRHLHKTSKEVAQSCLSAQKQHASRLSNLC